MAAGVACCGGIFFGMHIGCGILFYVWLGTELSHVRVAARTSAISVRYKSKNSDKNAVTRMVT